MTRAQELVNTAANLNEVPEPVRLIRPSLPPLADFQVLLEEIWQSRHLTNFGPIHQRFESELADFFGTPHVALVSNATLGLIAVMRILKDCQKSEVADEIVTSPFSFVATPNSIKLSGFKPVFADVDAHTLGLSAKAAEAAITDRTCAILAVHAFGIPCDIEGLQQVADAHNLPLIYDAAHAFGVQHQGKSLPSYGDFSVLSFHATKVFNTFEGGAVICPDAESKAAIDLFGNHGIKTETDIPIAGFNAKMSELHAAVGLTQMPSIGDELAARKKRAQYYCRALKSIDGVANVCPMNCGGGHNYYAFPVLVDQEFPLDRDALQQSFTDADVITRRYFYPLLSDLPMYRNPARGQGDEFPIAADIARRVLCLPLHPELTTTEQDRVLDVLRTATNGQK